MEPQKPKSDRENAPRHAPLFTSYLTWKQEHKPEKSIKSPTFSGLIYSYSQFSSRSINLKCYWHWIWHNNWAAELVWFSLSNLFSLLGFRSLCSVKSIVWIQNSQISAILRGILFALLSSTSFGRLEGCFSPDFPFWGVAARDWIHHHHNPCSMECGFSSLTSHRYDIHSLIFLSNLSSNSSSFSLPLPETAVCLFLNFTKLASMANNSQTSKGKGGPSGTPPTPTKTPNGKPTGEPRTLPNQHQNFQPKYRFKTEVILLGRAFGAPIEFQKLDECYIMQEHSTSQPIPDSWWFYFGNILLLGIYQFNQRHKTLGDPLLLITFSHHDYGPL